MALAVALAGCGRVPEHADPAMHGTACYACHGDLYLASTNPDHVAAGFSKECQTCHTTTAWHPADVGDHGFWPLTGAHEVAACESCHEGGRFAGTPRDCNGCHQADYAATTNPDHAARGFATTCETCHTTAAWHPATFDHGTIWPLIGAHAAASCESCHPGGTYAGTPTACDGCHHDDYQASTQPSHVALALPTTCESCHTAAAWRPAEFTIHDRYWPLTDKHAGAACTACHADGVFTGTPRDCEGCHMPEYRASTNPDHEALELPTACGGCHTAAGWRPADFTAHDQFWPIEGRHEAVACDACHADSVFSGTPRECEGCHLPEFRETTNPDHEALELPTACGGCHTAEGWRPAGFDAHDQFWPIKGQHVGVACEACHADSVFSGTPRECEGCHLTDFQATTTPDHEVLELSTACAGCHTEDGWKPAGFDAHDQYWPIEGKHETVACDSCHVDSVFAGTARTCDGCHLPDYDATTDPPHAAAGFPKTCETCHDASAWSPATFDHASVWPLTGHHATATCESCHVAGVYAGTPTACEGCHLADYQATVDPNHVALGLPTACGGCHTSAGWSPSNLTAHDQFWPLTGRHASATCEACHAGGVFAGTPKECAGCHLPDYQATTDPAHAAAGYPTTCETCHGTTAWTPASFDHSRFWPLSGRHTSLTCESCHAGGVFAGTPTACEGCHRDDYDATTDPAHAAAGYPTKCETCHGTTAWTPSTFDHARYWPLLGKHASTTCQACHADGVFAGTARMCQGCHLADYDATTRPPHADSGISKTCETCHNPTAWTPATLDHSPFWPLTGAHKTATCDSCHASGTYAGTPKDCAGCHLPDYQTTTSPAHAAEGYPKTCETCHSTTAWTPSSFDHSRYWPLAGKHQTTSCAACHAGGVFAGTPTTCQGCHLADYQATTSPVHSAAGFSTDCTTCHTATAWSPATFDHNQFWVLDGRHLAATCEACHAGNVYVGTPQTCVGCHLAAYQATTSPAHAAAGYPTRCEACHTTSGWTPATFNHNVFWPLTGRHTSATCESCHIGGVFAGTPRTCSGCHLPDYQVTTDPAHGAAGFSTACESCHGTTAWAPSSFNHGQYWPLAGQHATASCVSCHVGNVYPGTPTACESCHLAAYQATTNPAHAAAGFPTTCQTCHTASAWTPSTFDHASFWPLTGKHLAATCQACHIGGVYAGTPTACSGCHSSEYQATTNPPHAASGFPTTCESCHQTTGWTPATFDHNTFWPLTGAHLATTCQTCHVGGVYAGTPRDCEGCHLPAYQATTNPDHAASGFPTTCATCHQTTAWTPATFDHSQFWPLTGAHQSATCAQCHVGGVYAGTPTACVSCHQADYNASTNPPHVSLALSNQCQTCHTTTNWNTNTFPVHSTIFPIGSGTPHEPFGCQDCHQTELWSEFTCTGCHTGVHALATMNAKHVGVGDYQATLTTYGVEGGCLHCHPTGRNTD